MANYLDNEGILYTQEDLETAASLNGVTVEDMINENGLTPEQPGKKKSAAAKGSTVAPKKKKTLPTTESVSASSKSSLASNGKNPFGETPKTFSQQITQEAQVKKKKQEQLSKKQNIKKSNATMADFLTQTKSQGNIYEALGVEKPKMLPDQSIVAANKPQEGISSDYLRNQEQEALNYINSSVNLEDANQKLQDEINDEQTIDYIREGAKQYYNEFLGGPLSYVGQALGADVDLTIKPFKPLEEETKEARKILLSQSNKNKKVTQADINNKAKELFIQKQIETQKGKAAEEYFDNLDNPELQKKLQIKAISDKLNTSQVAKQRTMLSKVYVNEVSDFITYANNFKDKYNKGEITKEEIEEYKTKAEKASEAGKNLDYFSKDYNRLSKDLNSNEEKLNYFKYNYDDIEGNLKRLYSSGINILGGTLKFAGENIKYLEDKTLGYVNPIGTGETLASMGSSMIKSGEEEVKDLKSISFEDSNSFADFGKWSSNMLAEQIPVYASMLFGGTTGTALVSTGVGGQKLEELDKEQPNLDLGTKLLAAYSYAAAEFIPEKIGTLRMFDNLKDSMTLASKESRQLFKDNFITSTLKYAGKTGTEGLIEGSTEGLTELLDIAIDEQLLGKKITSTEKVKRIKEAFAGGFVMGGGTQALGGANVLINKELKNYASSKELAESKRIFDRIDYLQNELANNGKLTTKESDEIKSEINRLSDVSIGIIENSEDRVYDMSKEDMVAVLEINKKQADLKEEYSNLLDSNFSNEIKKEKIDELKNQFNELERNRNYLLTEKYVQINKVIGNAIAIDQSIDNIKKIANNLGITDFKNKIGNQEGIAVFETPKELEQAYREWISNEYKLSTEELTPAQKEKRKQQVDKEITQAINSDGFILPNGQIVINRAVAAETGAINVANHEFLHKVLHSAFENTGEGVKLVKSFINVLSNKEKAIIQERIDKYYRYSLDENKNKVENKFADYAEEYLTAFSDAIAKGEIKWSDNLKQTFIRLAYPILKYFKKLGFNKIDFESGQDVYNFIKDYNKSIKSGKLTARTVELLKKEKERRSTLFSKSIAERMDALEDQLMSGEIDYDTYESKMSLLEKEEYELSKKQYEEEKAEAKKETPKKETTKKDAELSDVAAKAKAKLDAIGNDPKGFNPNNPDIYAELDKMVKAKSRNWRTNNGTVIDFTNKDKGGLDGFSMEEMTSFVRTSMLPYIQKFDPSKNNSLYGYINAQYVNRMRAALKSGQVANQVFTEDVTEMKKLSEEDVQTTKPSLPERQRFQNILESGVFSPEVIANIQAKILPIIRTLKSKIDEKVSLNRTVAPIIAEIQNEIGKQADIDIKKAMGGKEGGELKKFLLNNKKAILENMTTTWLIGKDGKGGMPFAIQKRINGQWVNYPDWVGKKIDRESVTTDLAGRTAGHELVRRLPNVNNNVDNETFVYSIIDPETGVAIRGRKESLAKAIAEEIAMDIISDDMANEGILFQALEKNQQILGAAMEKVIEQEFNRLAERGNVKFSKTQELKKEWNLAINELNLAKTDADKNKIVLQKNSKFNKFISKLYNLENEDFNTIKTLILNYIDTKKGIYWWANEKVLHRILRKQLKGYNTIVRSYGGANNSVADISISQKNNNLIKLFIEIKKAANKNIPITSFTSNSIEDKYKNGAFKNSSNNVKELVEKIISYKSDLKDFVGNIGEITKTGNIKLTKEQFAEVLNKTGSQRYIFKEIPAPIEFIKTINELKYQSNDFIIIKNRVFDYFKGYTGVDNIENAFNKIDNLPENLIDNIFSIKTEFQLNNETNIASIRSYIIFNDKLKLNNNNLIDVSDIINEYITEVGENISDFKSTTINDALEIKKNIKSSKSTENNLNLNNDFNYNITNVSDYIKENNIKRINGEDAFDVLNDLVKRVEDFWGVVPNETIVGMNRAIDYAFDVIEDREDEGDIMSTLNESLNLETIKNAEKQLNEFVQNNINKKPLYSKSLSFDFNKMLEENKGVDEFKKISDIVAKRIGRQVNRFSFFVPPSADDFMGLTSYMFAASGKKGEADQEFFDRNLIVPYVKGVNTLDSVRQSIKKEYKALLDQYPAIKKKLEKLTPDKQFTYDQAIRVYLWNLGGIDVPGLTKGDKGKLTYFVKQDQDLVQFANALSVTGRQNGSWIPPSTTWDSETIISDLHNITEGDGRKKWLSEFIENADAIFSKENLNKVEFIYGTAVRQALEDSLYRMKNGKSRPQGADAITNKWMNWINGSTAAIMFFNTRSALLQTISALNFINVSDNNPYKAAKAFADQKQYWSDFAKIINSDKLKERRAGLKSDVTQAEIANAANDAKNKFNGVISYLQKIGFTPTQAADSFAIAVTGATFYRNRVNTYLKNGLSEKEAEDKAWIDFSMVTDKSMQSADPMYVSKQQTTALGRLILAFGNTPMQYNRLIKKASLDLVNRRGDWKENISKIIYYGALQNFIFSALQAALFLPFDDEEEDLEKMTKEQRKEYEKLKKKQDDKAYNILNGMLDTVLRGSGVGGAVVATIKNAIVEYNKQEEREMFADHAYTILAATSVSPPISSKLRKLYSVHRTSKFEKDVIQERGWEVTRDGRLNLSPKYNMVGSGVTAITNIPLDRLVEKTNNIAEALDDRNTKLQRTALMLGWKNWELNVKNEENEIIKAEAREKRKKEGIEKAIETRYAKKEAEKEAYRRMSPEEKFQYRRKKIKEKREKAIEKRERARAIRRKRRMG